MRYDSSNQVIGFSLNGTETIYIKNLQGDIIAIANTSGVVVAQYTYDAWGALVSITGSDASTVGALNPFRFKSYYYDTETELYYLQSRYYNPTWGRFVNADEAGMVYLTTGDVLGANLFAYCGNNAIKNVDYNGHDWYSIIAGALSYVLTIASWITPFRAWLIWASIGITAAVLIYSITCWQKDLSYYKQLYNNRKISYSMYVESVKKCNMAFYATVAACVLNLILNAAGLKWMKAPAISLSVTLYNMMYGFTAANIAWAIDIGYTASYNDLKNRLG